MKATHPILIEKKPYEKHDSRKAGMTLVEVMVAFALFGIGIPSVVGVTLLASRMGGAARSQMTALHSARAQMETLMGLSYFDSDLAPGTHSVQDGAYDGWYVVSERSVGETKDVLVRIEYPTPAGLRLIELEGVISYALH